MVVARATNALFQNFPMNGAGLVQMTRLEGDLTAGAQHIHSQGILAAEHGREVLQSLIQ
jgi:hypothetical protein